MNDAPATLLPNQPPSTILVVEDDPLIRFAMADYLRDCGYQVVEAVNGDEAKSLLDAPEPLIDLVFSDVHMPGTTDGFALARWVRAAYPDVAVILTSGIAQTADLGEELCGIGPLEAKPYLMASLSKRISQLLRGANSAKAGVEISEDQQRRSGLG